MKSHWLLFAAPLLLAAAAAVWLAGCRAKDPNRLKIDLMEREIRFPGKIYPQRYNTRSDRANGHHFIVFSGGGNRAKALIETDVPDRAILAGLEALGAAPGDNLTEAAWTERNDPDSPEPDKRVEGTPVDIFVSWNGESHPAWSLFEDESEEDFRIRFGGHEALIPVWESGCVTCLFSCPGGRTSNAAFTIRDQAGDRKTFRANEAELPPDGAEVMVRFRPRLEAEDQSSSDSSLGEPG